MTTEQKFAAILALSSGASLRMRKPGEWYVSIPDVEVKRRSMLCSVRGSGATPFEAIEDCWLGVAQPEPGEYLVLHGMGPNRRAVRWNGFMWQAVSEEGVTT